MIRSACGTLWIANLPIVLRADRPVDPSSLVGLPMIEADRLDRVAFERHLMLDPQDPGNAAKSKDLTGLGIGVWVSKLQYDRGEPIPVLFVVKNTGQLRGLDMRIDFDEYGLRPYNCADVRFEATSADPKFRLVQRHMWACGGPPLVGIGGAEDDDGRAAGYWCSGGDLTNGYPDGLLPGEYRLQWQYKGLQSNVVKFTVREDEFDKNLRPATRRGRLAFVGLEGGVRTIVGEEEGAVRIRCTELSPDGRWPKQVAAGLGAGLDGQYYYPDIRDLPVQDATVAATAKWTWPASGDSEASRTAPVAVDVTLKPRNASGRFVTGSHLHLALLLETIDREDRPAKSERPERHQHLMAMSRAIEVRESLTFGIGLPPRWTDAANTSGRIRAAVIVSTERLEGPIDPRIKYAKTEFIGWRGIVRTPWQEVSAADEQR